MEFYLKNILIFHFFFFCKNQNISNKISLEYNQKDLNFHLLWIYMHYNISKY
jgi:hypothetical protein